jgi:hypothetical protein
MCVFRARIKVHAVEGSARTPQSRMGSPPRSIVRTDKRYALFIIQLEHALASPRSATNTTAALSMVAVFKAVQASGPTCNCSNFESAKQGHRAGPKSLCCGKESDSRPRRGVRTSGGLAPTRPAEAVVVAMSTQLKRGNVSVAIQSFEVECVGAWYVHTRCCCEFARSRSHNLKS